MALGGYLRRLFAEDGQAPDNPKDGRNRKGSETAGPQDAFLNRLDRILQQRRSVLSGNIHLIGLQKIRQHLGESEWQRVARRAQDITQKAIQRNCGPDDVFSRYDELSFIIIFSALTVEQAQLRCHEIAEEIGRKLLGENFVAEATEVSTGVVETDGSLVFSAVNKQDLMKRLMAGKAESGSSTSGPAASEAEAADPYSDAEMPDFSFAQYDKTAALASIRVMYRPMWNLRLKVIANYFASASGDNIFGKRIWDTDLRQEFAGSLSAAEFDIFVARHALRDLSNGIAQGNRVLLCWPVHFETLAGRSSRNAYIQLCREIPDAVRKLLVFELDGLPEGAPQSRLIDIRSALSPFCRSLLVRLPPDFRNFGQMANMGLGAVGFSLSGHQASDDHRIQLMNDFVERATQAGLRCYVHGVANRAQALAAMAAGFEWIDGEAVERPSDLPGVMMRFSIADLYRDL